jgi:hypothetical protein
MKFCVSRILGNELPPRDEEGSRIKSLQFILDNENFGLNRMWVLNRIHDKERLEIFKKMLDKEPIFEIPFVNKEYLRCRNSIQKIHYATNINAARNLAFKNGMQGNDFIFILDGDCFFESKTYSEATKEIEEDQRTSDLRHYGIPTIRMESSLKNKTEPMLVFRKDADQFFDETIPFGKGDKIELVDRLRLKLLNSHVCHKSFSPESIEDNVSLRMKLRAESLSRLVACLDKKMAQKRYL